MTLLLFKVSTLRGIVRIKHGKPNYDIDKMTVEDTFTKLDRCHQAIKKRYSEN